MSKNQWPEQPAALQEWLQGGRVEEVECVVSDFAGIARGKVMPASKFAKFSPSFLPISIFMQSITGEYIDVENNDDLWTEMDFVLKPDLKTARAVPWASCVAVQVIHDMYSTDGEPVAISPRNILKKIVGLYQAQGWSPVVAPEIEFYLTKRNTDPDYPVEPPIGRTGRQGFGRQAFSISAVDEFEAVIEDIYDFAEAQGLEIDTIIQEGGAAQMEINLNHGDPVELADQVFFFKRTIREAAMRNDCFATFMAKPMADEPGSAMHIHQSVVDSKTGENVFANKDGSNSELFGHFLAGQQAHLESVMCILAPYVNSYRRLIPDFSAPTNLEWSMDNRTVGLRVPNSDPSGRRLENRVVGADVNPYLAIAACLACGYLGMMNKLAPNPEFKGNANNSERTLPRSLLQAMEAFEADMEIRNILGAEFCDFYSATKKHEIDDFLHVISPWEREHLLLSV